MLADRAATLLIEYRPGMGGFRKISRRLKRVSVAEFIVAILALAVGAIAVAVAFFYHPHPPPPDFRGSAPSIEACSIVSFSGELSL